jgi:hypothetical protein
MDKLPRRDLQYRAVSGSGRQGRNHNSSIKVKMWAELDKLGDIHRETYDDIIQRLIHFYKEHKDKIKK